MSKKEFVLKLDQNEMDVLDMALSYAEKNANNRYDKMNISEMRLKLLKLETIKEGE